MHKIREAMQEFATVLVEETNPPDVNENVASTVSRLRSVIETVDVASDAHRKVLEALLPYWGTVSDFIQRQEHGGQREGEPLTWEDARAAVFLTMNVMVEVDRFIR